MARQPMYLNGEYITNDSNEAAFLEFKGFSCEVNKSDPEHIYFIFKDTYPAMIQGLISEFWKGSRELKLLNCMRNIKKIIVIARYGGRKEDDCNRG